MVLCRLGSNYLGMDIGLIGYDGSLQGRGCDLLRDWKNFYILFVPFELLTNDYTTHGTYTVQLREGEFQTQTMKVCTVLPDDGHAIPDLLFYHSIY